MLTTARECINFIENIKRLDRRKDLKRMQYALSLLGNPHLGYKKVLVSGTNGKGSTLSFLKNILMKNNLKVGNFVSPYVVCFNERIAINNDYISDEDLIYYTNKVYEVWLKIKEEGDTVTFFEVLTLLAFLYFKDKNVDYALMEIGIEGKLDSTNVADYDLLLITNVGYDHMNILGETLEQIASEIIGIVKPGNHLITTENNFQELFINYTKKVNATIDIIETNIEYKYNDFLEYKYLDNDYRLNLIGHHQVSNSMLAINAAKYLMPDIDVNTIKDGLFNTTWPGRFEFFNINDKKIIIDGAHNIDGVNMLVKSVNNLLKEKIEIMFCALKDKETSKMVKKLEEIALSMTFTTISDPRVKNPNELLGESNHLNKKIVLDFKEGINEFLKTSDTLVVTGSLHFISDVRNYLISLKNN